MWSPYVKKGAAYAGSFLLPKVQSPDDAFAAGADCAKNGANTDNCHFSFFSNPELKRAWERGKASMTRGIESRRCRGTGR